ncbi:MAG: ABC transporter permease, partial [Anaerolineales bacterium]|nr:ABC transporter permease [Anaerolineales bacterium]
IQYILRRMISVIPMALIVSFVVFALAEVMPGNFVERRVMNLKAQGIQVQQDEIDRLIQTWGLDKPFYVRYWRWLSNLLRGDLGQSAVYGRSTADLLAEAGPVSLTIAAVGLLITWIIALPVGIYSATHQYAASDYLLTLLSFFGLGTPGFLIALIVAYFSMVRFGFVPVGIVSPAYANQPWNWAKIVNFLGHMTLPFLLAGLTGTGGLVRTMRNNLLDQLRQPYVVTARAKGLSERKLLLKYPVRLALNPFISSLAFVLPAIFSGDVVIAATLGLPTVGAYMYTAIAQEDPYLAGTLLLFYSVVVLVGTLISDILLAAVDPRIRLGEGGAR